MAAWTSAWNGKIYHLGGKDKSTQYTHQGDLPIIGIVGDLFGAVNALFSGLAFAGLIYTIFLQKQDLKLQRVEIALNRTELKKSANAQQHSEKALYEQVEQMKISAKLNALNTLINYYNIQIANTSNSEEVISNAKLNRKTTIQEIDVLVERVSDIELE